jgi:hypothetical protein
MKNVPFVVLILLLVLGCSKKPDNNGGNDKTAVVAAILTFPDQNQACTTGTIVSDTESSINFTWNAAANADSYELDVKNLLTSDSSRHTITGLQLSLTLSRNTPYSWFIIAKSSVTHEAVKSAVWKFYNPGPGIITYAPYPAELLSPSLGQLINNPTVDFMWTGSTVNNIQNIVNYDFYLGTTTSPSILKGAITNSFINGISVTSGTTYYWKVITRDTNGNTSESMLFQFTVN